jgi:alkyl sulfatase BDS1-like metallo-beta-lactamase superfamily hydrolase
MSPDTIKAMPTEMTFDYFTVRLNGEKAAGGLNRLLSNKNLPGASDQASANAHIDY